MCPEEGEDYVCLTGFRGTEEGQTIASENSQTLSPHSHAFRFKDAEMAKP